MIYKTNQSFEFFDDNLEFYGNLLKSCISRIRITRIRIPRRSPVLQIDRKKFLNHIVCQRHTDFRGPFFSKVSFMFSKFWISNLCTCTYTYVALYKTCSIQNILTMYPGMEEVKLTGTHSKLSQEVGEIRF